MAGDKGKSTISEMKREAKFELIAYAHSAELQKEAEASNRVAFAKVLDALDKDEATLHTEHQAVLQRIREWKGDIEKEVRHSGGRERAEKVYSYFQQLDQIEQTIGQAYDQTKALIDELKSRPGTPGGESVILEAKNLAQAFSNWKTQEEQAIQAATGCDQYTKEHPVNSPELKNYKDIQDKLDDLINGTGVYKAYGKDDRYKILLRYLRAKEAHNKRTFDLKQKELEKVRTFVAEYAGDINDLVKRTEPNKVNKYMYFEESLKRVQDAGMRHLYPLEAFQLIFDGMQNPLSPAKDISEDMRGGKGEWLSIAVKKEGNTLLVAFDPQNLAWKDGDYAVVGGNLQHSGQILSFDIGHQKDNYYHIEHLPHALVLKLWGLDVAGIRKLIGDAHCGIWVETDKDWRPVGRGDINYRFILDGISYSQRASRGVRPRA